MAAKSLFEQALNAEGVTGQLAEVARSIYQQESGSGKNTKTSNANAHGGMQIIPSTFKSVADKGWDINDPLHNARAGIRYLAQLDKQSGGNPTLTAAGYYGGPGGMEKARKGIPVSDPKNPNAPNTLQYAKEVVDRIGSSKPASVLALPDDQMPKAPPVQMAQAAPAVMPVRELPPAAVAAIQPVESPVQATPQQLAAASQDNPWAALGAALKTQSVQPADLAFGQVPVNTPQKQIQIGDSGASNADVYTMLKKFGIGMYAQDDGRYQANVPVFTRPDEIVG